jgi:RNA polymerase sigma-70 factor, ECF subfamily
VLQKNCNTRVGSTSFGLNARIMRPPPDTDANQKEATLVTAVQAGDLQAFEPLVRRHLDAIHAFVALKLPVAHLVDELTHETFVVAFRCIEQFAPGTSFRAWLRAIAMNRIRAEIERQTRDERNRLAYSEQRILELAGRDPNPEDLQAIEALRECIQEVPEHLRAVLTLRYQDEQTSEQIARQTQRSMAWVRTTLCRVRQQLRECVEKRAKLKFS